MAMSPKAGVSLPLPAVIDLGRRIAALSAEIDRQDDVALQARDDGPRCRAVRNAVEILNDQREALQALVATMPARSLADATVQVAEAFNLAIDLECNIHSAEEVERLATSLVRLVLSILPVVAVAAELDPAAMGWESEVGPLYAARFVGLEGAA